MSSELQQILAELRRQFEALYGERLERVVLYGSQARGDATPDSDIDVLVVLTGEVDVGKELWRISAVTSDLSISHNVLVSTVVMSAKQYHGRQSSFLSNVVREGKTL
jgi:predicted nucleotidyltransferase